MMIMNDDDGDNYGDDDYEKGTMVAGAALRERWGGNQSFSAALLPTLLMHSLV